MRFSYTYVFRGRAAQWWVGGVFSLVGLLLGFGLPRLLQPTWLGVERQAIVSALDAQADLIRPVFAFMDGSRTVTSSIASSYTSYHIGDHVVVVTDPASDRWYVKADQSMIAALWIVKILAIIFFGIGMTILGLTFAGVDDAVVQRVGGMLGALSFAVPSIFALPALYYAYLKRPNVFFDEHAVFGAESWIIGGIFTFLGVLVFIVSLLLYRYQARTGKEGWSWSWKSEL